MAWGHLPISEDSHACGKANLLSTFDANEDTPDLGNHADQHSRISARFSVFAIRKRRSLKVFVASCVSAYYELL